MAITRDSLFVRSSRLDPQELRFALLFWERLAWPISQAVYIAGGPDEQFLEQIGILKRPIYHLIGSVPAGDAFAQPQINAFLDLESREPGLWAIAQGDNSFLLQDGRILEEGRGALVELHRAIPVPDKDVPLNDILEFRVKRRDELVILRERIDSFFSSINSANDKAFELQRHVNHIEIACADLLRTAKERGFPLRMSDLKSSFELRFFPALVGGPIGWKWGAQYEMPLVGAALGAAAAVAAGARVKISIDFGMRRLARRASPYRYVYHFHDELF